MSESNDEGMEAEGFVSWDETISVNHDMPVWIHEPSKFSDDQIKRICSYLELKTKEDLLALLDAPKTKAIIEAFKQHEADNFGLVHSKTKIWKPHQTIAKDFFKVLKTCKEAWLEQLPDDLDAWPLEQEHLPEDFEDLGDNTVNDR